jgi:hypothetical protein
MRPLLLITDISYDRYKERTPLLPDRRTGDTTKSGVIFPLMTLPGAFLTASQGAQIRHW